MNIALMPSAGAAGNVKNSGHQSLKPAQPDYWPNAPWRNDEFKPSGLNKTVPQTRQPERLQEPTRERALVVSDPAQERQRLNPEARRELRHEIHKVSKELYR